MVHVGPPVFNGVSMSMLDLKNIPWRVVPSKTLLWLISPQICIQQIALIAIEHLLAKHYCHREDAHSKRRT